MREEKATSVADLQYQWLRKNERRVADLEAMLCMFAGFIIGYYVLAPKIGKAVKHDDRR